MNDTKELAKQIWLEDDLNIKKELSYKMIDSLVAKKETKEKFKKDISNCKSKNKIDKLAADITLVGYDMKVVK